MVTFACGWPGYASDKPIRRDWSPAMTADDVRDLVNDELKHIPLGTSGSPQNELRMIYNALRAARLAGDPDCPRAKTFAEAVAMVRETSPEFRPDLLDPGHFDWSE